MSNDNDRRRRDLREAYQNALTGYLLMAIAALGCLLAVMLVGLYFK